MTPRISNFKMAIFSSLVNMITFQTGEFIHIGHNTTSYWCAVKCRPICLNCMCRLLCRIYHAGIKKQCFPEPGSLGKSFQQIIHIELRSSGAYFSRVCKTGSNGDLQGPAHKEPEIKRGLPASSFSSRERKDSERQRSAISSPSLSFISK